MSSQNMKKKSLSISILTSKIFKNKKNQFLLTVSLNANFTVIDSDIIDV